MEPTIRAVLDRVHASYKGIDGDEVAGYYPGLNYQYFQIPGWTPFYFYTRDTATILPMARYYQGPVTLRSSVEELLRQQYPDGSVSATIDQDFNVDKATVVSDEETSLILAAAEAFDVLPDPAWLNKDLRGTPLVERLNRSMRWLLTERLDAESGLIMRAHTTDWGDVKIEVDQNHTDMRPGDQWTVSIYDQAIGYAALRALSDMNWASGRFEQAVAWAQRADLLREQTDAALWMDAPNRGYYRIHRHVAPDVTPHELNEDNVIAIGNAAALYYGLAEPARVAPIVAALERAKAEAGAPIVGMVLNPPYQRWFESQMDPRVYQNGAIWDWWGGRQITGEFRTGERSLAIEHLAELARDWATHPGEVREWESPWLERVGREQAYAGAAAVVGQAVVEGLFGVDLYGQEVRLAPRLGDRSGRIRLYQPANDLFVAYRYQAEADRVTLTYNTNSPKALSLRLPNLWGGDVTVLLDGSPVTPQGWEQAGAEYLAVLVVPQGAHRVELVPVLPPPEEVTAADGEQ